MAWPTDAVATGELITAAQLNGLPVRIANTTLAADAASIDFQSIPGHYAHLMLVCYLRGDVASTSTAAFIRFNNDSGGNYDYQYLSATAAVTTAAEVFAATAAQGGTATGNTGAANLFGATLLEVPHYANAANNKAFVSQCAVKWGTASANLAVQTFAGFWRSNSAINRVTVVPQSGNWRAGSRATLYGIA